MFKLVAALIFIFILFGPCLGKLYDRIQDLPSLKYDFLIVGGGTAGNVIANRLTEDPKAAVLLLEAGPSNEGQVNVSVPFLFRTLRGIHPLTWNYTTVPLKGLNGRVLDYPRGHVLGGASSTGGMIYTRGSSDDYDKYAKMTGDPGWSWDALQPYIRKNEIWTDPIDHHNTTGQFNPAVHGFHGINAVSLAGFPSTIDSRMIETTKQLPEDFPFNLDSNSGTPLGLGWRQATIKKGVRSSSATSYLGSRFINRPNLHVLVNARVTKLIRTSKQTEPLRFGEVEFTQDSPRGPRFRVQASKEVILSAGPINTPFLLMHSGIGDRAELSKVGIQTLLHLPSVGKNASDHPVAPIVWQVNDTHTLDDVRRNITVFNEVFKLWNETHKGPMGNTESSHLAWKRLPEDSEALKRFGDPSAGPKSPHLELAFSPIGQGQPTGNYISMGAILVTPASRGAITLASNDPFQPPLIDPGVLDSEFDILALVEGLKMFRKFITAPVWQNYIIGSATPEFANATTDVELEAFIRDASFITWELSGTAAMSGRNAGWGVVNPDLRVKGVDGLRVIDGSVFPFTPSGHLQAPTYIFAERAADIIKSTWRQGV